MHSFIIKLKPVMKFILFLFPEIKVLKLLKITKIAKIIIPVFLIIVICYTTNTTINQHFHKLSSGIVVHHAHPFDKKNTDRPLKEHDHNSPEFILLEQISISAFWIYLFFTFFNELLYLHEITNFPHFISPGKPALFFLRNYHAPPDSSF